MWLAKHATTTSRGARATRSRSTGPTVRSLGMNPISSALVESDRKTCTPRRASSANAWRSVGRPSSGVWSSLKSPECSTVPNGVSMATATPSGMLCVTRRKRMSNGPSRISSPGATVRKSARSLTPCSSSLPSSSASVSEVPYTGRAASRNRYGSAPMWSSCPWVRTAAWSRSRRSLTYSKSGSTRSIPGISA